MQKKTSFEFVGGKFIRPKSRDLPLERDIQSLRQNSIRPPFNPTLTRPFSINRLGSNQVNQQQTNSLHSPNIREMQ
jgi:hypothetical protein